MNALYAVTRTSKQAVHQRAQRMNRYGEESAYLVDIIREVRMDHPTLSCQALYYKVNPATMGRDRFIALCMQYGFRVQQKANARRTTDSTGVIRFPNLTIGIVLTGPDQLWCSDITFYEIKNIFYYLTFILDAWSRRIVGWNVSARLTTEQTSIPALKMAMKTRKKKRFNGLIFHSDGGGQYYDKQFLTMTQKAGIHNSMCEHAWENGKAERVNGIIKNNYLIFKYIEDLPTLVKMVKHVVDLYNNDRPHSKLKFITPVEFENDWYLFHCNKVDA